MKNLKIVANQRLSYIFLLYTLTSLPFLVDHDHDDDQKADSKIISLVF